MYLILMLWIVVIVFNLVWINRKKPYQRMKTVILRKLKSKLSVRR